MQKILPLGSCLPVDQEGYLVFKPRKENLQPHWRELLDGTTQIYRQRYGENLHSAYVRGTVAKGQAIDGISDLDTFALVREGEEEAMPGWSREAMNQLLGRYPFCTGIECIVLPLASLDKTKPPKTVNPGKRLIKTQSLCVFGENLVPSIPPIRPGLEMVAHLFHLAEDLPSEEELKSFQKKDCTWLMKRIVRSGFELVIERAQTFSRASLPLLRAFRPLLPRERSGNEEGVGAGRLSYRRPHARETCFGRIRALACR